jgi:hypothetical protein
MTAIVPNIALGRVAHYGTLPEADDAIIAVVLATAGLESLATLKDYDDLGAILAAANDEATFTGYSRQTLTGVTVTVDDTGDTAKVDAVDPVWSPTSAEAVGMLVLVYDPDTTGGTDADLVPIHIDDAFALTTPTSGTVTYQIASGGFFTAS